MHKTKRGRFRSVAFPLAAGAFVLVAVSAAALAFTPGPAPSTVSAHASDKADLSCLSPLIQDVGAVCCPGGESSLAPCLSSGPGEISTLAAKLPPLYVNGVELPLPIVVQLVKKSLGRAWSRAPRDRNVLVCRLNEVPGSQLHRLYCDTDDGHFHAVLGAKYHVKASDKKVYCYYDCFLTKGNIVISILRYVNGNVTRDRRLAALLSQAPDTDADYSLRMPQTVPMLFPEPSGSVMVDTPVYVTFVVQDGDLKDVQLADRDNANREPARALTDNPKLKKPSVGPSTKELTTPLCLTPSVTC